MKDAVSLLNICSCPNPKPTGQAKAYARPASKNSLSCRKGC